MGLRCPVCKADNSVGPNCRRCKADLTLVFTLEGQREAAMIACRQALEAGAFHEASEQANRANELRSSKESMQLLAMTALMLGEHARVWRIFRQATEKRE